MDTYGHLMPEAGDGVAAVLDGLSERARCDQTATKGVSGLSAPGAVFAESP
jgi:hypothetical protein